jgi:molybdopterin/thiamine biosynthesis adenylyltransferase
MSELLQRMSIIPGWHVDRLDAAHLRVVVAARGPTTPHLCRALAMIGVEEILLVAPPADLPGALDAAEAASRHSLRTAVHVCPTIARSALAGGPRTVVLQDVGDAAFDGVDWLAAASCRIAFAEERRSLAFGLDVGAVARGRRGEPLQPSAETPILFGELLNALAAEAVAFERPDPCGTPLTLSRAPACARIPLAPSKLPALLRPVRLLVAGGGGAIAHQSLLAVALDPSLRAILARPGALVVVVDDGVVEESNRSRQYYDRADVPKAPATAAWLRTLLPGVPVEAVQGPVDAAAFARFRPTHVVSSLDSWGRSGRLLLAELCRDCRSVEELHAAGSDPFGGMTRTLYRASGACQLRHGAERLLSRGESRRRSCADSPQPSSVIPQLLVGGLLAVELRRSIGREIVDPRGFVVNLLERTDGLSFRPGLSSNARCDCPGIEAGAWPTADTEARHAVG